ncbi:hypothetical protein MRB53_007169 [Persea americana]|uniref:Uncharacterized protein n=1 Tax=Persea americana TaxID=3435 RepID=A0ACC2MIG1_PERAE|nr:hypothetical protein MRB53_007169 [Persea americana]
MRSPSPYNMQTVVLHAISLLRWPQISNAYARQLSGSASLHISHAIATDTKAFELLVSIEAIDEFMINELDMNTSRSFKELQLLQESREEEIPRNPSLGAGRVGRIGSRA